MPFAEAVLLFSVFFLPGYFQQGAGFDLAAMLNPSFHLFTMLFSLPQMLLLLYILRLRNGPDLGLYGIGSLRRISIFQILLSLVSIFGITLFLGIVQQIVRRSGALLGSTGIEITPNFYATIASRPSILIFISITCLLIGYFEELFFRVYLISEFASTRRTAILTVLLGSVLFAAGHAYQGIIPAAATFFIGVLLGYRFLARRSWHEIALAHALYNFVAILIIPAAGGV